MSTHVTMPEGSSFNHILNDETLHKLIGVASRLKNKKIALEALFAIIAAGKLGMRPGEIIHISHRWIDTVNKVIIIPDHISCECSYCQERAEKYAEDRDCSYEEALKKYWQPKTDRGQRPIPYGEFPNLVVDVVERYHEYLQEEEGSNMTYSTLLRRIRITAELTPGVRRERIVPRVLRATAASRLARMGITMTGLQRLFGWRYPHTAAYYLWMSGANLTRELRRVHGNQPRPKDQYILTLRYAPPTVDEWRENYPLIDPDDGYTPTPLDDPGQLETIDDDEEYLLKTRRLQEFSKDLVAHIDTNTDTPIEDEDISELDDPDDSLNATISGLGSTIQNSEADIQTLAREIESAYDALAEADETAAPKFFPTPQDTFGAVYAFGWTFIAMAFALYRVGIRVEFTPFTITGPLVSLVAVCCLWVLVSCLSGYLVYRASQTE